MTDQSSTAQFHTGPTTPVRTVAGAPCGCIPGQSRCREADSVWEAANAVYRSRGYDAWLAALEPYNEHNAQVDAALIGGAQ